MSSGQNRRSFMKQSLAASAGGALALYASGCATSRPSGQGPSAGGAAASTAGPGAEQTKPVIKVEANSKATLPMGQIGKLKVSRMLLGGNLLTHYTHSRDLQYVYNLCAHYNTEDKIHETMALAEAHGINTLSIHNPPGCMAMLKRYRQRYGGKIQWIVCPIAEITPDMKAYAEMTKELVDDGCEAIYLWGVRSDPLCAQGKMDLVRKAVEIAKDLGVPSGVGCHDLNVVVQCEKNDIPADFYIKTFHHHKYPSAPKPNELKNPYNEVPGYWCKDPAGTIEVMKNVKKPWISFKVMAAGAIPPKDAFRYVFENGADHTLAGMFDFEIAEDVQTLNEILPTIKNRARPWCS